MIDIVKLNNSQEFNYLIGNTFGACHPFANKQICFTDYSDASMNKRVFITLYSIDPEYYVNKDNSYIKELPLKNISGDISTALINCEVRNTLFTCKYNPGSNKCHPKLVISTAVGSITFDWQPLPLGAKLGYVVLPISFRHRDGTVAIPEDQYHEDIGPVIWWKYPITEAPYVGTPLDSDWIDDYYTHFTELVVPHTNVHKEIK